MSDYSKQVLKALEVAVAAIGGEARAGQIKMAQAVANALNNRHHLLVQAGTGTGKSLAYLVPALVHGKKVLVATATLALQRQLVERDLPKIKAALEKELNRDISFAIYKGVGNYICLQKLNNSASDPEAQEILDVSYLESDAKRLGGLRLLPGHFMLIEQAMGQPQSSTPSARAALASFISEMKSNGFVHNSLHRHRIEGATVSP